MNVIERPWWPIAVAATHAGLDVVVLDPEGDEDESFWDEVYDHGRVLVVAHRGAGWVLTVTEPEAEV